LATDTGTAPGAGARLGAQERAVLSVLVANRNRVIGRRELSRQAGFTDLSERRCDSVLVGLRRVLGHDAIITVRSRGWMLAAAAAEAAAALL
ncbi:MAG: helix-turn-helix domain-containing protein, partial [Acidobacteria bacterium]|nr:helix-turn-helix domain-containing protein [Acidobacteriota bacterium]